ncbi:MAG: inorganic pyrophosphatase [Anaerolinea sp.]|nr:inorganic pyrophosphatase [Anaerolinea sp.]
MGREVDVVIDRPLGSTHPREPDIRYTVNYGFVPGTVAPDGHEVDIYVLGSDEPLERCRARVIAIIRRRDDVEDKLVGSVGGRWDREGILKETAFQEQYFDSWVEMEVE